MSCSPTLNNEHNEWYVFPEPSVITPHFPPVEDGIVVNITEVHADAALDRTEKAGVLQAAGRDIRIERQGIGASANSFGDDCLRCRGAVQPCLKNPNGMSFPNRQLLRRTVPEAVV